MDFRKLLAVSLAAFIMFVAVPCFAADVNELERRLDIVSEELDRLKSPGGSGIAHRTLVHGYGETHWQMGNEKGDSSAQVDQHRFVIGVHSEIADWIHFSAEIDFEHAATEIELEYGHLDFLVSQGLNFRAGTMLMPMGNLNEFHEPNNFYTVERPDFHSKLIPSSWQQAGAGIFGSKGDISYRAYLTNAVSALDGSRYFRAQDFIRKGRSQIIEGLKVHNMAVTARVEKKIPGGQAGFSIYTGGSAGDFIDESGNLTIVVMDYKTKQGPWDLDFGVMKGWVADTKELNTACASGAVKCSTDIPQSAFGLLGTFAVHVPELMNINTIHDIIPFIQYQKIRPNDKQGEDNVSASNHKRNYDVLAFGAAYKPHPQVALKASYRTNFLSGEEVAGANNGDAGTNVSIFDLGVAYSY